jgi:hypothetical protein
MQTAVFERKTAKKAESAEDSGLNFSCGRLPWVL